MVKEEQILSASIIRSRSEAQRAETELSYIQEGYHDSESANEDHERYSEKEEILLWHIESMLQEVAILAERLSLPILSKRSWDRLRKVQKEGAKMAPSPYDVGLTSVSLADAKRLAAPLLDMVSATAVSGLSVFEAILRNTAAIVNDFNVNPSNESEVQKQIFRVLQYAIHDVEREVPISQISKNYKMDFGARSIAAAAEYKYVNDESELKKSIEAVYADMKGYRGNYDFRTFYAVFYQTAPISNADRIEAEFRHVGVGVEWKPIVICGRGGRKGRQ